MKELVRIVQVLTAYVDAIDAGINKFAEALPIYTKQHIDKQAKKKLNSTYEHYMENVDVKMKNFVLLVELDRDDWLSNAVETGVGQFNMKETMLKSPKAKVGKSGYKYMRIPIGHKKGSPGGSTDKSKEYSQRINAVLNKTKVGISKMQTLVGGKVAETQQIIHNDPMIQGLYRTRMYDSPQEYYSGKKKPTWQYVLFRTISENPTAKSKWQHPGIQPVHIFRETERWLEQAVEPMVEHFIEVEIKARLSKLGEE